MRYLLISTWLGVCFAGLIVAVVGAQHQQDSTVKQGTCPESQHLLAGEVIERYSETIEKQQFYYVIIAGKVDGKYHTRNVEVNKWMWTHSIRVGDYWTGN